MARLKHDEITEPGFYWMKNPGKRPTVIEVRNIPSQLGSQTYNMWHVLSHGSLGAYPLHEQVSAKFNGPIKPPRGFEPATRNDPKPTGQA